MSTNIALLFDLPPCCLPGEWTAQSRADVVGQREANLSRSLPQVAGTRKRRSFPGD